MPEPAALRARAPFTPQAPVERDTLAKLFLRAVERFGRDDALLHKEGGAWRPIAHRELEARVARVAAALHAAGIARGDRIAILSENRWEWAVTDYAAVCLGCPDVPVYATLPPRQVAYILKDCGARAVFCSTREQLAKVLEVRGELPELRLVVSFDDPGGAPDVQPFAALLAGGAAAIERGGAPDLRALAAEVGTDDVATLIYTSGTTGDPKGVMLTHRNLCSNVAAVAQHGIIEPRAGDVALSFLPLSHVFERTVDYFYFDSGITIAYAESMDRVADNLVEVRPTVAVSVPRLFEKIHTRATGATGLRRALVRWAGDVGGRAADRRLAGEPVPAGLALQARLADRIVFSKLRARTGGRVRMFISGGAPLAPDIARFFVAAGLPVYEGYGLTETSPVICANRPGQHRLGTVGVPFPGVEVAISAEGEILTRGPHVMKGYWNRPDATAEVIDAEGWFHTGDIGEIDADGFLRITDRLKNLLVTAGGKNIAPAPIENAAALSPYVAQAVMLGDRRPYPILLLVPDLENVRAWAAKQGIAATDPAALAADPRVEALLRADALSRLAGLARYETPKKVLVLPEELTVENGALTPSLKVKRRVVEERFRAEIEALYAGGGGGE